MSVHRLDVTSPDSVAALAYELDGRAVDVLINNAGIYGEREGGAQDFGSLDFDSMRQVMETNLLGPLRVSEALVNNLLAGEQRKLATVSSVMGSIEQNDGQHYAYRTSKAAVNCAMRGLAKDLAARGVTVLALHPGWVQTRMGGESAPLQVEDSAMGLRQVIAQATAEQSGAFMDYQGDVIPW